MPEHVHLVLHPPLGLELGRVIGQMKARSAHRIIQSCGTGRVVLKRANGTHGVWQRRCYDYNCRTTDEVREKIEYCHKNPVRRGLVVSMSDWPWSSYRWYAGKGDIVLDMDGFEE